MEAKSFKQSLVRLESSVRLETSVRLVLLPSLEGGVADGETSNVHVNDHIWASFGTLPQAR